MVHPMWGAFRLLFGNGSKVFVEKCKQTSNYHQACINIQYIFQYNCRIKENNNCNDNSGNQIYGDMFKPLHKIRREWKKDLCF